jgi:pimeloyl-ACP methyl ester carboxylesterase
MNMVAPEPDWRAELAKVLPTGPEQADKDAHVTFDVDIPQVPEWVCDGARASRLSLPVVYFWGSESGPMGEAAREHFLSPVPKAQSVELPGVNHSMNTKAPGLVAGAIAEFLARLPRSWSSMCESPGRTRCSRGRSRMPMKRFSSWSCSRPPD